MKFIKTKKGLALLAGVVATAAMAVGAYACWTTTGTGSGTGAVANSNGTLVLHGAVTDALYPGGSSGVTFTADNLGSTDLQVGTVHLVSVTPDSLHASCNTTYFSMPDVIEDFVIPHGQSAVALPTDGTMSYANDPATSQDSCKGATLTLTLSS